MSSVQATGKGWNLLVPLLPLLLLLLIFANYCIDLKVSKEPGAAPIVINIDFQNLDTASKDHDVRGQSNGKDSTTPTEEDPGILPYKMTLCR